MNRVKKWVPLIVVLFLILSIIYVAIVFRTWFYMNGLTLLGWLGLVLSFIYNKSENLYWFVQKVKYTIINPDTQWELCVRYKVPNLDTDKLQIIRDGLCKAATIDRAEIISQNRQRVRIKADELDIELSIDDGYHDIEVIFTKIPVSFRGSRRVIDKRITPILENIENRLEIGDKSYWLTVYFGNMNPYYGLYIRRIRQENISSMNIRIGSNQDNIELSKQKITLTTSSLNSLNQKAKTYLTLSELPA